MIQNDPIAPYMRWEYRDDARWGWPGYVADNWISPGVDGGNMDVLEPGLTDEEVQENQMVYTMGLSSVCDALKKESDALTGEFIDVKAPACEEEPGGPDVDIHIRVPKDYREGEKLPVLFYIFGAGFIFNPQTFDRALIDFCDDLHCIVVAPNYRLHPVHKFPANINDLHAAYNWVLEHGAEYNMDTDKIVLTGESGGGWYSISLAHRLKRYGLRPRGIVAVAPVMEDRGNGTSSTYTFNGTGLDYNQCMRVFNSLLGVSNMGAGALSPEAIPNHATVADVQGMPPMCISAMESDPCRDGAIEYAQKLLDAGVFCSLHVWGGVNHSAFSALGMKDLDDALMQRAYQERLQDIQAFFDYDFDRSWRFEG